jgi:cholesterol transport system auxiliary component
MKRALWLVGFVGIACLEGCVASHPQPRQFDLGEFIAPGAPAGVLSANIIIPEVTQPSWIRSRDIFYRLDYEAPDRPHRYVLNRWVATPGEMVTLHLRQAVQAASRGFTLSVPNRVAGYVLQTDLEVFTQSFRTPQDSHCIVELRASLWKADGQIGAQRTFHVELAAPTPDAPGAVRCLVSAVDRESDEIIGWLAGVVTPAP